MLKKRNIFLLSILMILLFSLTTQAAGVIVWSGAFTYYKDVFWNDYYGYWYSDNIMCLIDEEGEISGSVWKDSFTTIFDFEGYGGNHLLKYELFGSDGTFLSSCNLNMYLPYDGAYYSSLVHWPGTNATNYRYVIFQIWELYSNYDPQLVGRWFIPIN